MDHRPAATTTDAMRLARMFHHAYFDGHDGEFYECDRTPCAEIRRQHRSLTGRLGALDGWRPGEVMLIKPDDGVGVIPFWFTGDYSEIELRIHARSHKYPWGPRECPLCVPLEALIDQVCAEERIESRNGYEIGGG